MKKKQKKIQTTTPINDLTGNWQLIQKLQTFINNSLQTPHIFTNVKPNQEEQKLMKHGIQKLVKLSKSLMQVVDILKAQQKNVEQIKHNAMIAQEKIEQHQEIIKNYQKKFSQRTKALVEENKIIKQHNQKMKKSSNQHEETLKLVTKKLRKENQQMTEEKEKLQTENKQLLMVISDMQRQIQHKNQMIDILKESLEIEDDQLSIQTKKYKLIDKKQVINNKIYASSMQKVALCDTSALSKIISFLNPKQICNIMLLNRLIRLLIIKSKQCQIQLCKSLKAIKNKQIKYYHRHIIHFEAMYHKIPEEILQMTYFQYHILKEVVGSQILGILNSSSAIFQGKFVDDSQCQILYQAINQSTNNNITINKNQANYLEVDEQIIQQYLSQKKQQKQKLMKQFETMYKKITNTFQLYSADIETSNLFIRNMMKHFSKVFVLGKNLYIQAQSLQKLNTFILSQLSKWDKMEIDKNIKLEDLKAQMEAQKKLKHFFTDKSIKSQQKALLQQNLKLNYQLKSNKLSDMMNMVCQQKQTCLKKSQELLKTNKLLFNQNKQIKRLFQHCNQKHNKLVQQLTLVRENIVRMNII